MVISGRVNDPIKKASIQDATVTIVDNAGNPTGLSMMTDIAGNFRITSNAITTLNKVVFSHPEYYSKTLDVTGATSYGFVSLTKIPAAPVVVVPEPEATPTTDLESTVTPPDTTPYPMPGGGGGGGAAAPASGNNAMMWFWIVVAALTVTGTILNKGKITPAV